jgi:hypothetical protein
MSDHVQLVTATRPHYLALKDGNVTTAINIPEKYATTTRPASGSGSAVMAGGMNYLKILPRFTDDGTAPSIRVIGWSKCNDSGLWNPHLITDVTGTLDNDANNAVTINGTASMFTCHTFTKGQGDAKLFNVGTALDTCAFIVVDTLGFDLIELAFRTTTTAATANAHIGDI